LLQSLVRHKNNYFTVGDYFKYYTNTNTKAAIIRIIVIARNNQASRVLYDGTNLLGRILINITIKLKKISIIEKIKDIMANGEIKKLKTNDTNATEIAIIDITKRV